MHTNARLLCLLLGAALGSASLPSLAANAYARFPAIRGDTVVFTAEGDLWKVGSAGGRAQRLTSHPSAETNAAISHDGQWVAFSAAYEGGTAAYAMPIGGGLPKRLSFDTGGNATVVGWTAQGKVLVTSPNTMGPDRMPVLSQIDPRTLARTTFPLTDANEGVLDDEGKTIYFTRFGAHSNGDNARAYRGGAMARLWKYDIGGKAEAVPLLAEARSNLRRPMWWKGRVYFLNDAGGTFNLWSMNPDGGDARALTKYTDLEVRNPALGDGRIVFQVGPDLHVLDLASMADRQIDIDLVSDFDQMRTAPVHNPLAQLTNVELAGKGERIVVTARGHVLVAGTTVQRRIEVPVPRGARAREAVFSHDDKAVYAIVDSTGENEIWKFPIGVNSDAKPEVLTKHSDAHRYNIYPSPDGKWLAHTDGRGRLWLLDLASKVDAVVDTGDKKGSSRHDDVEWAPDSKTIALVRNEGNNQRLQIGLLNVAERKLEFVTTDKYDSRSPSFSPDGKWLYFLSNRNFNLANGSPWGDRNMGPVFDKRAGVFALALQPGNRFPFKPDDELNSAEGAASSDSKDSEKAADKPGEKPAEKAGDKAGDKAADKSAAKPAKALPPIVMAGIAARLYEVPLAPGNYANVTVDDKRLYFLEHEGNDGKGTLKTLAISKTSPQPEVFVAGVRSYYLARDKKHILYRTFREGGGTGDFMVVEAGAKVPTDVSKARIALDDWTFTANPREEWQQMFNDAWRMHRDFLYDNAMRGVDWAKTRAKYAPMAARVTDRDELNDVLSMMMSEVGAMHSQLRAGDVRRSPGGVQAGALGAVTSRVAEGYRIDHIYRTDPELPAERGPFEQPDADVREGDTIVSVNGSSASEARDLSDLLMNQAGKQVLLRIKRGNAAPRPAIITAINANAQNTMRYTDWERRLAARTLEASQGKIGYLHLRAMGPRDIAAFAREFYSHVDREGLVIDVRRNNGGSIDSWIIEKLLRKAWAFWNFGGSPTPNMQQTFRGHLVVLTDEHTYSDGETFAAGIKTLKLGPVVGRRTSGAGVWLSDSNPLSDNGMIRVAEFTQYGLDGNWIIEGVGVVPDVDVENMPVATFNGGDQQLDAAISLLQQKLKAEPVAPLIPKPVPALR
jgi:tricorn protease